MCKNKPIFNLNLSFFPIIFINSNLVLNLMILHVDMSNHYEQKNFSVIAIVSVDIDNSLDNNLRIGLVIDEPHRSTLLKKYTQQEIHAASIAFLIKDLTNIKRLIVCPDINPPEKIMSLLNDLIPGMFGRVKSLSDIREEIGDNKLKSQADSFARNINTHFEKRRNIHRIKEYFIDKTVKIISELDKEQYNEFIITLEKIKGK
jgi:hypothetical protein